MAEILQLNAEFALSGFVVVASLGSSLVIIPIMRTGVVTFTSTAYPAAVPCLFISSYLEVNLIDSMQVTKEH